MAPNEILKFWFEESTPQDWFTKSDSFDSKIKIRFGDSVQHAIDGDLNAWANQDESALALVLLLDQFTRNIFRNSPKSFVGDNKALETCIVTLGRGYLQRNSENHRYFMLMPMMHSENIAIQDASLPLFKQFAPEKAYGYAVKHRDIIAEYGRFPHRNEVLGRKSTSQEIEFLKEPGSSF
jgi:uncharacterized protein (DUF924 family)